MLTGHSLLAQLYAPEVKVQSLGMVQVHNSSSNNEFQLQFKMKQPKPTYGI